MHPGAPIDTRATKIVKANEMSARSLIGSIFAISLALVTSTASAQNLLTNGDFENPGFSFVPSVDWQLQTNNYRYLNTGANAALADWIVADNNIGQRSFIYHDSRYAVSSGHYGVALDEGTSITSGFNTQRGGRLDLSLNMTWASCPLCLQPSPLEVVVDGQKVASFAGLSSDWRYSDMTHSYSASFVVGAGAHTLTLSNPQHLGDFREYRIDNVVLTAAPVPEPEIPAMLMLGLGMIGVIRRRTKMRANS